LQDEKTDEEKGQK